MTVQFALDFIPRRMRELGYGDEYITRWRFLQMESESALKIEAQNEYYLLIDPLPGITVRSKAGVFDMLDRSLDEMQYEHKGKIQIKNTSEDKQFILFIQVIPNHSKTQP